MMFHPHCWFKKEQSLFYCSDFAFLLKGDWEPGAEKKFGRELQDAMEGRREMYNEFFTIFALS
jgi:hypothetical protein